MRFNTVKKESSILNRYYVEAQGTVNSWNKHSLKFTSPARDTCAEELLSEPALYDVHHTSISTKLHF